MPVVYLVRTATIGTSHAVGRSSGVPPQQGGKENGPSHLTDMVHHHCPSQELYPHPDGSIGGDMSSILVVDSEQTEITQSKMIKVSLDGRNDVV